MAAPAEVQSTAQVALEAGNNPQMIFQHYRELARPVEAAKWFGVTSEAVASAQVARDREKADAAPRLRVRVCAKFRPNCEAAVPLDLANAFGARSAGGGNRAARQ